MNISIFEMTIPQFILTLTSVKKILVKAGTFADQKKMTNEELLKARLAPDQFPLGKQIQIACDVAKFCASRLTGEQAPSFDDSEKTVEELCLRIDKTIDYLRQFKPEQFMGYEKRKASFPWYPGHYLDGHNYLIQHAVPNFFFHVTTAYSILRFLGVELGKADYLGNQNWKAEQQA
jgi:uncharacterized protein